MEEPSPLLRVVIVDGGQEADLLKQDLAAVASVAEVQVVIRLGQAHALLKRGFNALCIDLFDPAVRPEQGVAFIETTRREFPHVPICLFSKAEELESLPGVDSKWTERLRHYLQVAAENSEELPKQARELARDFQVYLTGRPAGPSGASTRKTGGTAKGTRGAATPLEVIEAKHLLRNLGFYSGALDARLGPELRRAVSAYQAERGIPADGELSSQTLSLLLSEPRSSTPDAAETKSRAAAPSPADAVEQSTSPQARAAPPTAAPPTRPPADAVEQPASPRVESAAPTVDTPAPSAAEYAQSRAPAAGALPALNLDEAYALLRLALASLTGGRPGRMVRDEEIRQWMETAEPRFDLKDLGFSRFSRFLRTASQVDVIDLARLPDRHYEATLPPDRGEPGEGVSLPHEPEAPLNDTGRVAMAFAGRIGSATTGGAGLPFSVRLLAGVLVARPPPGGTGTAAFFADYLKALRPSAGKSPAGLLGLPQPGIDDLAADPGPAPVWADSGGDAEQLAIQGRALEFAATVRAPGDASPPEPVLVSTRHLFAVLIAPAAPVLPAQAHLETLGCRLDDLRWRFLHYVREHAPYERQDAWRAFLLPGGPLPLAFAENAPAAAYDSDADGGRDRLNITPEVNALAAVLASRELEPPLAVGLFGDWGTGKSFFMRRMRTRIRDLAREARDGKAPGICPNIVQIPFNAWHYMDANLWASLVTGVFDGLANALSASAASPAVVRERLLGKLAENHAVLVEAERRLAAVDASAERARTKLDELATKKVGLRQVLAASGDVATAALAQPRVRGELDQLAAEVGLPQEELSQALERLETWRGKLRMAWRVITGQTGDRGRLLATAAYAVSIVAVAYAVWWLADSLRGTRAIRDVAAFVAAVLGVVTHYWAQLRPIIQKLRKAQPRVNAIVDSAREAVDASATRTQAERDTAARELAGLEQEEAAARQAQAEAVRRRQEIEEEIAEIQAGRRLHRFISERSAAEDYRRHLGLVALIRNDFQHLSALLRDARGDRGGLPPVDRIILYIDDLDRCPEKRVVEVLQAVHLLLAFKLFVVVVGVDSRWLLRSVQSHYSQLRADRETHAAGADEDDDEATPQNYLEKIFQIPFTLRAMDSGGYRDLVGSLIRLPGDAAEEEETEDDEEWIDPLPASAPTPAAPEPAVPFADTALTDAAGAGTQADAAPGAPAAEAGVAPVPPDVAVEDAFVGEEGSPPAPDMESPRASGAGVVAEGGDDGAAAADRDAGGDDADAAGETIETQAVQQALVIEAPERAFLQQLSPLIPSPRSAKRLVNVYRFIRASLTPDVLGQFRGSGGLPGEYQAVALLLAVLTGFPTQAVELFRALNGTATHDATWWEFCDSVERGEVEPAKWEQFRTALAQVRREVEVDDTLEPFVRWAPHVARFSFQTGQIFARRHG